MNDRDIVVNGEIVSPLELLPQLEGWEALAWIGQTDKLDAAHLYVRVGMHPIAVHGIAESSTSERPVCTCAAGASCSAPGKHPVHKAWQAQPLDLEALDRDLRDTRRNIGLRMGKQPNGLYLVCVDIDGGAEVEASVTERRGKPFAPTLTARTGRGGTHRIYQTDIPRRNKVGVMPKVDIRSEGGFVVCAPSLHASGNRYQWLTCMEPGHV
jgi:putative DNA primase/helicase